METKIIAYIFPLEGVTFVNFLYIHFEVGSKKSLSNFFLNKLIFMMAKSQSCRPEEEEKGEKKKIPLYHFCSMNHRLAEAGCGETPTSILLLK